MAEGRNSPVFSPKTLYQVCVSVIAKKYSKFRKHLTDLPNDLVFDIYYQLYKEKEYYLVADAFKNVQIFSKMLMVIDRRVHLLQCFQSIIEHGIPFEQGWRLSYNKCRRHACQNPVDKQNLINLGLRIGEFISDAGWYIKSEYVLLACKELCIANNSTPEDWCRTLGYYRSLLHVQAAYCEFLRAEKTYELAVELIDKLKAKGYRYNCAALYTEFSVFFYMKGKYDEAYRWSIAALKELEPKLPPRITIDVLRQASKSCVLKREFRKAGLLIREAVYRAKEVFGVNHPVYSNVLIDYGYYWLNFDSIINSVTIYKEALDIRREIFGKMNLHVALAHEDLAYAFYVYEYRSGKFPEAGVHIDNAIDIMNNLLHGDHLLLASAKRINALILEEIALDNESTPLLKQSLLFKAECLHLSALQSAEEAFGEQNVQTAKHYGNLGRVYQSMRKFKEAEQMHLKAIRIKEQLLGPDDHEVGLSVGHLASLYNYHMNRYRDAEKLYHRSIKISLKLFGKSYSGLEYDYDGLLNVYTKLNEHDKVLEYTNILTNWKELRNENVQSKDPIDPKRRPQPIEDVINIFFSM
ncbi:protein interacting with APP tail-1 isoform X1 [Megachile rotundata]|uniref:protein interacting with APP tail-1 isoform X1 n=2 Tax=Megachile rotundata TaxID=143995 RepID=UPI000258D85D|nr:PREDICTED: amyloid protein-binding protein 2 isoform X1 [Megachile rotundata]